jgi:hypothetical protein
MLDRVDQLGQSELPVPERFANTVFDDPTSQGQSSSEPVAAGQYRSHP